MVSHYSGQADLLRLIWQQVLSPFSSSTCSVQHYRYVVVDVPVVGLALLSSPGWIGQYEMGHGQYVSNFMGFECTESQELWRRES
jgi:hypothetical protein